MPELAVIDTGHFSCVIWSKDVRSSQQRLRRTLEERGQVPPVSDIRFSPPLLMKGEAEIVSQQVLDDPVFFENKYYEIEFLFRQSLKPGEPLPEVRHKLKAVEDAFHYSSRSRSLRGSINTGNHVGAFSFTLAYPYEGSLIEQSFTFDVLPLKMDMQSDFKAMNDAVDAVFPLWRYSLAESTSHSLSAVKKPHSQFLLLWFARFESLHKELLAGLKHVVNAPHSRLMEYKHSVPMSRLKGRLSRKQEEQLALEKANKNYEKSFTLSKKRLHVDTPENRFIKAVLEHGTAKLQRIQQLAAMAPESGKSRFSDSFLDNLASWQKALRHFQKQPFFREVGDYTGMKRESLVLQQKPGYSKVYKIWQQLKWYLELLDGEDRLSLRNVAEMYEVWCFLEVRRILLELGFIEIPKNRVPLVNTGIRVSMQDGMAGAFHFQRPDGVKVRLAHEPLFKKSQGNIRTWLVRQKPDILLEATFPDGAEIIWLFDAKYRIDTSKDDSPALKGADRVPDDAINQMHRYRDALIHRSKFDDKGFTKTRPVFGAYVLYPGFFNQLCERNPYGAAINGVGIGAFSLLPQADNKGSHWLSVFLKQKLGDISAKYTVANSDRYFVEDAYRISGKGYSISHYQGLTILASQLGPDRNASYMDQFRKGDAKFYHTKMLAFTRQEIEQHIASEARYLAVALDNETTGNREVDYIYPIVQAKRVQRGSLTEEHTGTPVVVDPDEWFWLFELGPALKLKKTLIQLRKEHFELKLAKINDLSHDYDWDGLPELYSSLMKKV
ncbi:DUF2357 domain-containing protein [uncultured Endozoicomonas sp.]|uniref:DUF2357 domain-containing protein n=1 Tax=uncultured Endozoicomonas sp. TaxID=432652 RepID=UPI002616E8B1|nr:DUF2357 domain-containing protein [uncultured Endozoicomonas sp.]